ncbi:MAG: type VI secretion system contractile sheath protein TssC, partial [Chryseobacterium sp.]|nr:type VI secretion system contractile sheath protein TssC [Chryseobacterium sp.]
MDNKPQAQQNQQAGQQQQDHRQGSGSAINDLNKVGGFNFIETVVDGIANMNPTRKARKEIFLNDSNKQTERKDLAQKLNLWISLLENNATAEEMAETCKDKAISAEKNLKTNLKNSLSEIRQLETAYRTMAQFFKNTELDK